MTELQSEKKRTAVTEEKPGTCAVPVATEEKPGTCAVPAVTEAKPGTCAVPAATEEKPGTFAVPAATEEAAVWNRRQTIHETEDLKHKI